MPRRYRRTPPRNLEAQVWDELKDELDTIIPAIAAEEGLAPGATRVSPEKEVELWGQRDPRVDRDHLKAMLMQGQVPPEWVDEQSDQRLALLRVHPEQAEMFTQPLDDEMAGIVADMAEWPYRKSVWGPYADDPKAMVEKANSVNARWERRTGMVAPQPAAPSAPNVTVSPAPDTVEGAAPHISAAPTAPEIGGY